MANSFSIFAQTGAANLHRRHLLFGITAASLAGGILPGLAPSARAQDKAAGATSAVQDSLLDLDWSLHYGDEADFSLVEPLVPSWRPANLGIAWERQNMRNGEVSWLRKDAVLPDSLRGKPLHLDVKMVAGEVDAYCNGQLIGQNKAAGQPARFDIPASLLKWGEPNRFALRVAGHWWTGGVNDDVVRLASDDDAWPRVEVEEAVGPADYLFPIEDDAVFTLNIRPQAGAGPDLNLSVEVISDFHATLFTDASVVEIAGGDQQRHFNLGRLQPGFYQVVVRYSYDALHGQRVFWFGVAPERIVVKPEPPADFNAYWKRAKSELAQIKPDFKMVLDEGRSTPRHHVYSVEMTSCEGIIVRCWYIVPSRPGRYPAILQTPGYSVAWTPERFQSDDDIIHLALDVRGQGRSTDVINPGFGIPGLFGYRIDDPEHYVYKGMYLDCGRALEFLLTRPEVDTARIAVAGGSQGGGLAFASAALYPEIVKICVAASPYLGDFVDHMRIRDLYRGELQGHIDRLPGVTWENVYRSMSYVDTVNLASRIRCPVFMGTGLFDDDCPSRIGFAVYNNISSPKSYRVYPRFGHMLWEQWDRDSNAWLRHQFHMAAATA